MLKVKELVRTNVMIDKILLKSIEDLASEIEEDKSTVIRQLIKKGLVYEKIELAIKRFLEGLTFRKAASLAGLDYWDFQMELDKRNIPISRSITLAKRRLAQH